VKKVKERGEEGENEEEWSLASRSLT